MTELLEERIRRKMQNAFNFSPSRSKFVTPVGCLAIAAISFVVYALPLWHASRYYAEEAVLDEMHLISEQQVNADVQGTSSWKALLLNDYWGRPLDTKSSHKSWRPLSVVSFRYLSSSSEVGLFRKLAVPPIFLHR